MSTSGLVAALLLRHRIYQTLTAEERCLVALRQFEDALTIVLANSNAAGRNATQATSKATDRA